MNDFTKFRLPTRARWAELKMTMTRDEQIDFLCQRMRLLNCFQWGQPGGYDPAQQQYAEPCGLGEDAAWGGGRGKTEVINPLTELTGRLDWRTGGKRKLRGLRLTIKDIPRISKYLREDYFALIVSFWRDFAPDRYLTRTRELFAGIINEIAHEDICSVRGWDQLPPAEIDKEIERINKWADENQHKVFEDEEDRGEQVYELLRDAVEEPGLAMTLSVAVLLGAAVLWRLVARLRGVPKPGHDEPRGSSA